MNSANQEYLCQLGAGFTSSGLAGLVMSSIPCQTVAQRFHTSALLADSWPPLAKLVSMAG